MRWIPVAAALAVASCGGTNAPAAEPTPAGGAAGAACSGEQVAVITNDWIETVEVYARIPGGGTPTPIGMVRPGERSELVLQPGAQGAFVLPTVRRSTIPPEMRQLVRIRYQCR